MKLNHLNRAGIILGLAGLLSAPLAFAGDQAPAAAGPDEAGPDEVAIEETTRCIYIPRIRSSEVVTGDAIVFRLSRNVAYLNRLPSKCPGLERERAFTYRVGGQQLCSDDHIRVLETRTRLTLGDACRLGEFQRLAPDAEDAE